MKMIKCACGCGKEIAESNQWGRKRKYLRGHNPQTYKQPQWQIDRNREILADKLNGMKIIDISDKYALSMESINLILSKLRGKGRTRIHLDYCPNHPERKNIRGHNLCDECFKAYHSKKVMEWQKRKREKVKLSRNQAA